MYTAVIVSHSWMRWVVIILGLIAVFQAMAGRSSQRAWSTGDAKAGRFYTIALDVQVLLGLALYLFLSPIVSASRANMAEAMANSASRFWLVEHLVAMIVALALAHIGTRRIRRARTDRARFGRAAFFYGLSLAAVIVGSPWPGLPYARALLRLW
jgi:uncharacterized membrane protein